MSQSEMGREASVRVLDAVVYDQETAMFIETLTEERFMALDEKTYARVADYIVRRHEGRLA